MYVLRRQVMDAAKITSKGQITIPAKFRKMLKSNTLKVTMKGDEIILKPIIELGGIFQEYAFKDKPIEEVMNLEKDVFADAIKEKHSNN